MSELDILEKELKIYINEINDCVDQSLIIAKNYCDFRGMVEGFKDNIYWLDVCDSPSVIRYVNSVTKMLRSEFITLPWKVLECDKDNKWIPAQLVPANPKRVAGDGVKSLSRACKLFEKAYTRFQDSNFKSTDLFDALTRQNILSNYQDFEPEFGIISINPEKILSLINEVDELSNSEQFIHLSAARHEGIAHSLDISFQRVKDEKGVLNTKFTIASLLSFGEKTMELVYAFEECWRRKRNPKVVTSIQSRQSLDQTYWSALRSGLTNNK